MNTALICNVGSKLVHVTNNLFKTAYQCVKNGSGCVSMLVDGNTKSFHLLQIYICFHFKFLLDLHFQAATDLVRTNSNDRLILWQLPNTK